MVIGLARHSDDDDDDDNLMTATDQMASKSLRYTVKLTQLHS